MHIRIQLKTLTRIIYFNPQHKHNLNKVSHKYMKADVRNKRFKAKLASHDKTKRKKSQNEDQTTCLCCFYVPMEVTDNC